MPHIATGLIYVLLLFSVCCREREHPNQLGTLRLGTLCDVRHSNAKDLHTVHALDLITMDNVLTICCRGREQKLQWAKILLGLCAAGGRAQDWRENGGLEGVIGPGGSGEKGRVAQVGDKLKGVVGNVAEAGACGFVALLFKLANSTPFLERMVTGTLEEIVCYAKEQNSLCE
jgi:hypothetical protein